MKKPKKEMVEGDATHLIERLEAFEERVGVRLEALFAHVDPYGFLHLRVKGELHPREGTTIKHGIEVRVDAYDSADRLVATGTKFILESKFFGFEAFEISERIPTQQLSKIRVYPKKW